MSQPLRILFVEDIPTDCELAERELRSQNLQFSSIRVETQSAFVLALKDFQPDLIISDYAMPEFDGMQALKLIQELNCEIPFIMLTGSMNEETAVECMKAGASDYVIKEHVHRLPFAVQEALKRQQVLLAKGLAEERLRESESKFRSLFLNNHAIMWLVDPTNSMIIEANPAACDYYGWTLEEITRKRVAEINILEETEVLAEMQKALTEQRSSFQFKHRLANGEIRDVEVYSGPIEHNGKTLLYSIIHDITARKQAEAWLLKQSHELQQTNIELARLYRTSGSLISSKPFDLFGLAQAIVETVIREVENSNCCLHLIKKNTNELIRLAFGGEFSDDYRFAKLSVGGPGSISHAIRTQQILNINDVNTYPGYVRVWENARSELVVPLILNDRVIGVMDLESDRLGNFSAEDEKLLQTFANQAAIVLENTNLNAETNTQVQRLKSLRKIDETINSSLDIGMTTSILLEQITNQLSVDAANILIFSPFTKGLKYINGRGFLSPALQHTDLRLGQGLAGRAAMDRQIVHISDLDSQNDYFTESPFMKAENFVEYYGVPLISKGNVKGLLEIFNRTPLGTDETWMDFLGTLAGQAAIAIDNIQMFDNLQQSNNELTMAYDATIEGWSRALDLRDKETEGHTRRVTEITVRLAKAVGLPEEDLVHIRRGALLHDIGKMGISDSILLKPGSLTDEEWGIMRKHPDYAFILLSPITFLKPALDIPYCHHEKWDGSGYPRKLKGEQIPMSARLFAVADVWDALTSDRPYRIAWSESKASEYIREQAGEQFDPFAVELFFTSFLADQNFLVKPTILIVDDEENITRSLARSLKDLFTVLTATTGEAALKIVERADPAVVLTDQRMPGMSGVELLERIRAIKPNTVGILISGYSDVVALTAALNLTTVRGFIPKPWDLDQLRKKLDEAVAQYRAMAR